MPRLIQMIELREMAVDRKQEPELCNIGRAEIGETEQDCE